MGKYTDEEIRAMPKITLKIAADYLGISPMMVSLGMRNNLLPIGFAAKNEDGIYEKYDADTGEGKGCPCFSWSSAFIMEFILNFL